MCLFVDNKKTYILNILNGNSNSYTAHINFYVTFKYLPGTKITVLKLRQELDRRQWRSPRDVTNHLSEVPPKCPTSYVKQINESAA